MKTLFIALEADENDIQQQEIADLFNVRVKDVLVTKITDRVKRGWTYCGKLRNFRRLTDIYVWTCKYHYGLYEGKLVFLRIKGVTELNEFFTMKYLNLMRFVVSADSVGVFDKTSQNDLDTAWRHSNNKFHADRLKAIKPFLPKLTPHFNLLYHYKNPF